MEITWFGHSCFRITERNKASVVTDPYNHAAVGYKALKLKSDIVTVSHDEPGHNYVKAVKGTKWQINGAGEYEIGGVFLTAVPTGNGNNDSDDKNMAFVFDYEGVSIVHLGAIKAVPSRKEVEAFGNVDILLVPVGGGSSLSAPLAAEVVNLIEPGIVIPMQFSTPGTSVELNELSAFLKQMGLGGIYEEQESLKVSKRDIPGETRVTVLSYKRAA